MNEVLKLFNLLKLTFLSESRYLMKKNVEILYINWLVCENQALKYKWVW